MTLKILYMLKRYLQATGNCFKMNNRVLTFVVLYLSFFQASSIVRTVALAFKAIGKLTRERVEREARRARRTHSISSSERTRTNSEVSTTSTIGSSSVERRHPHVQWKHGIEGSSGRRSPHGKKFNKSTTSPSILRHPTSSHTSGRHVEFSALSPVPSDGSDSDGKEAGKSQANPVLDGQISVQAEVHVSPALQREPPVWIKRDEPIRRSSLPMVHNEETINPDILTSGQVKRCHSVEELQCQTHSEPLMVDTSSPVISPPRNQKENFLCNFPLEGKERKTRINESGEIISKEKIPRELDLGRMEKEIVTENFVTTTPLLPIERFQKETLNSADRLSANFAKYKGHQPQDMSLPLSDSDGPVDAETVHNAISAVERGETALVEKYIDDGVSVDAHDTARRSLLYYAVSLGDVEMSQLLLKR